MHEEYTAPGTVPGSGFAFTFIGLGVLAGFSAIFAFLKVARPRPA